MSKFFSCLIFKEPGSGLSRKAALSNPFPDFPASRTKLERSCGDGRARGDVPCPCQEVQILTVVPNNDTLVLRS